MQNSLPEKNTVIQFVRRSIIIVLLLFCTVSAQELNRAEQAIRRITKKEVPAVWILVSVPKQQLYLITNGKVTDTYTISTAKTGCDSLPEGGSNKTPPGLHYIESKIGDGAEPGTIFRVKRNTGKKAVLRKTKTDPYAPEDLVLTRVLPLMGMEPGLNKGKNKQGKRVDSFSRAIYIHGTNNEADLGTPNSHGCIRMYNSDVITLFNKTEQGMLVYIAP